ncbi:MAG: polysaccharide deacetylase family protein [Elusimicrobia bacterium]|nr:polysaccharide deacetylase family protein [Candidatus Obscuribacterium magneticum]
MRKLTAFFLLPLIYWPLWAQPKPGDLVTAGSRSVKQIALTLDDGPGSHTEKFLDLLDRYGVKATFFLQGTQVKLRPKVARELLKRGHEIGQHTYSHVNFLKRFKELKQGEGPDAEQAAAHLTKEEVRQDMQKTQKVIFDTVGVSPRLCRIPHGIDRPWIKEAAKEAGLILVNWTFGADWTKGSMEELKKGYTEAIQPGAIILLHDGWPRSEKSLILTEEVLKAAKEKGFEVVPVGQLIGLNESPQ